MRTIWIITFLAMACSANAGPWLRPDGDGFMSLDSIGSIGRDQGDLSAYSGLFAEYGLSDITTFGFVGGIDQANNGNATAFLKWQGPAVSENWITAFDLGLGANFDADGSHPHLRIGTSLGRGGLFHTQRGWTQFDAFLLIGSGQQIRAKLEATLGTRGAKDWIYLLQLFAQSNTENGWDYELAQSIAVPLKRKRHLQIGLLANTQDGGRIGLKAALWHEF